MENILISRIYSAFFPVLGKLGPRPGPVALRPGGYRASGPGGVPRLAPLHTNHLSNVLPEIGHEEKQSFEIRLLIENAS